MGKFVDFSAIGQQNAIPNRLMLEVGCRIGVFPDVDIVVLLVKLELGVETGPAEAKGSGRGGRSNCQMVYLLGFKRFG